MSNDIRGLKLPLEKMLARGEMDRWLRGISGIVPVPVLSAAELQTDPFNVHSHATAGTGVSEIKAMVGFRQLLQACTRNDIRVDIELRDDSTLKVRFEPTEPFSRSSIFGAGRSNVVPMVMLRPH